MSKIFINFTWDQLHCFHVITFMPCIRPSFFYTDFRLCISGSRKSICPKKNSLLALQQSVYDIEHLHTLRTVQMFFHSHTAAHTRSDHNHHRVIRTVRIQVQTVPAIYILLQKSSDHRVVKPCTEIILSGGPTIHLPCISQAIGYISCFLQDISKGVIVVRFPDFMRLIQQEQGASRLVLNKGKTTLTSSPRSKRKRMTFPFSSVS